MTDLLELLNPQQREAVTAGEGPMLVLAGPGSGKTRVLTHRIAFLIGEMGIPAHHIMAVTFTNKAAAEMRLRVEDLLGGRLDGLQIGTFHAICARLLRIEADQTPYGRDYTIYDTDDQVKLVENLLKAQNLDTKKFKPYGVLNAISAAKNELIEPDDYRSRDYFGEAVARIYPLYQRRLVESNAMDFDDLLMQTVLLFRNNIDVREKYQRRYEHILVDEFQDTNQAQYQLVRLLGEPQENVFVVGDEDQGIYAFRGADYRNVMQFRKDYPAAKVIVLAQNYRSTDTIVQAARAVIDKNKNRQPKALFSERGKGALVTIHEAYNEDEEAEYAVRAVRDLMKRKGYAYRDFAVIYRTNAQSRALEDACVRIGVPYKLVGGVGFYKRREIRDLLAYMRVVNNANDVASFTRIVNVPGRGIGEKSVQTFDQWVTGRGISYADGLEALANGEASPISGKAARSFTDFALMIRQLRELLDHDNNLLILFDEITARTEYNLYIREISDTTDQAEERLENVKALRGLIQSKKDLSLEQFLEEIALVGETDSLDAEKDAITLLTMHAAKGLEFAVVFITGVEDGLIPHSRSKIEPEEMAEERRLFYVGLTRAKDQLYLTHTFKRSLYGESSVSDPSPFLTDIPAELTDGAGVNVKDLRNRAGYKAAVTWDSTPSSRVTGGKVISFEQAKKSVTPLRFKAGMRVKHPKLGEGTVIDSQRDRDDEQVQVHFKSYGTKTFLASLAGLVILDK
ncbi:MAG: UvrD-helicase domain-containing protein [Anaerolinea sp.]|nr:UvrD-helicase domain-containing protein [Anaerolinea sp.]